jgi:hypothetical protein
MELDEYINLEARVSGRMVLLDISATGEENIIEHDEKQGMNDLEYRRRQLQQLQETVVDMEDVSGGVKTGCGCYGGLKDSGGVSLLSDLLLFGVMLLVLSGSGRWRRRANVK